jgi:hypothetical protein
MSQEQRKIKEEQEYQKQLDQFNEDDDDEEED